MIRKFIRKYIYDVRSYAGKLLWIDTLGFHIDFRKWYYYPEEYESYGRDWEKVSWIIEWDLEPGSTAKRVPLIWEISHAIIRWRYRTSVKWMTVGYLICAIIKS